jgi:ATP-dependent DNA ligase
MSLPIQPPISPMEARSVDAPPEGKQWQYEPKWDGFRCLIFKDGEQVYLQSKSGQPLARYFPEIVEAAATMRAKKAVVDGELIVPFEGRTSFDQLLQRVHPAASRVRKLAAESPALFVAFDLLVDDAGTSLVELPLKERRAKLVQFAKSYFTRSKSLKLSPSTPTLSIARKWSTAKDSGLDGIVAKLKDAPYLAGSRDGMQKIKHRRTADCVVGGFRYSEGKRAVGSLLLGLYDADGKLQHVGYTSSLSAVQRRALIKTLKPLMHGAGFSGKAPGGPSRWSTKQSSEWEPLKPNIVVEVEYDNFTGDRFRHGTHLLRFRPDKRARQCTLDQVLQPAGRKFKLFTLK